MKKLLLILFVVTWKTYVAIEPVGSFVIATDTGKIGRNCVINEEEQRKEFSTETEARKFAEETAKDRKNWDVEIWEMKKK